MVEAREVDPQDEAGLSAWYAALRAGATAGRAAPLIATYGSMAVSFRQPGPRVRRLPVAAVDGDRTVGALLLDLPQTENLSIAHVEIAVPPAERGRGVGAALWEWTRQRAAAAGRTVLQSEIHVPAGETVETWPGARFAAARGFTSRHVEDHLVLDLPAATPPLAVPGGYELVTWAGPCPPERVDDLAAMRTAMARDVPAGEMIREPPAWDADQVRTAEERMARSYLSLVAMLRSAAGEPSGYTNILLPRDEPDDAFQDDTFVATAHRRRGLATVLKTANLAQLHQHAACRLHTWTAPDNAPMQATNARFGFGAVERTHTYELS